LGYYSIVLISFADGLMAGALVGGATIPGAQPAAGSLFLIGAGVYFIGLAVAEVEYPGFFDELTSRGADLSEELLAKAEGTLKDIVETTKELVEFIRGLPPPPPPPPPLSPPTPSPPTPGVLAVSPATGLIMSGDEAGPFTPTSQRYTLTNTGGSSIDFSVSKGQSWISLSTTGGSLAPGASTTVLVAVNSNATMLSAGTHSDTVTFSNTTSGNGTTSRSVTLTVNPKTLIWAVNIQGSAAGITDSCIAIVSLPASGGSISFPCGPANVTVTTVGISSFNVNGTYFYNAYGFLGLG